MDTLKLGFFFLLGFSCALLNGQDTSDPFTATKPQGEEPFDAFAEADRQLKQATERGTPQITLLTEFIQISQRDWSVLSRDERISESDPALRREVAQKLKSGHALLLDMSLVSTVSGFDFVSDSFEFHIFPSEFNPPQIDEKNGRIVPASYSASECWKSGFTAQGSAILSEDFERVDLNIVPEYVDMSGISKAGSGNGEVTNSRFTVHKIQSNLSVTPGEFALVGVFQAHQPDHSERADQVVLVFLRPTIQVIHPDSAAPE